MKEILLTRESLVWAVLMALTLGSWLLGTHQGALSTAIQAEGSVLIILTLIKVYLIIANFMEVRHAPGLLRLLCNAWIAGVAALLLSIYNGWLVFA